jgi:hypothetical protein
VCNGYALHDKDMMRLIQVTAFVAFCQVAIRPRQELLQDVFGSVQGKFLVLWELITFWNQEFDHRIEDTPELA